MKPLDNSQLSSQLQYAERTVDYYLQQLHKITREPFTAKQLAAVQTVIDSAIPKPPAHKIIDLRVPVDLIVSRFYFVLFVGKDQRENSRVYELKGLTKIANRIAAFGMLLALNLTASLFVFLGVYLIKSFLGINLFSSHLSDSLRHLGVALF